MPDPVAEDWRVKVYMCPECLTSGIYDDADDLPGGPAVCEHPSSAYVLLRPVKQVREQTKRLIVERLREHYVNTTVCGDFKRAIELVERLPLEDLGCSE